jgi:hypothetical protein
MSKREIFVVLFESFSHALSAEKILKAAGLACKLIPVPRHLSSDCGVCLSFAVDVKQQVETVLKNKLEYFEIKDI